MSDREDRIAERAQEQGQPAVDRRTAAERRGDWVREFLAPVRKRLREKS